MYASSVLIYEGCIFDDERARLYASVVNKGFAARLAFAAACFGEFSEALFWMQLPHALLHFVDKSSSKSSKDASQSDSLSVAANISIPNIMPLAKNSMPERRMHYSMVISLNFVSGCVVFFVDFTCKFKNFSLVMVLINLEIAHSFHSELSPNWILHMYTP